jgi:hypothetical protein
VSPAQGGMRSLSPTLPQHQGCVQIGIFPHTGPLGPASAHQIGLMGKSPTIWDLISVVSYFGSYH